MFLRQQSSWFNLSLIMIGAVFSLMVLGASSCGSSDTSGGVPQEPQESPLRCVPEIEGDAFRTGQAVTLLEPSPRALNDHCIFQDAQGVFHLVGIDGDHPFQFHFGLAHGVGAGLDAPMERLPNILANVSGVCTTWAPTAVIVGNTVRIFYTDSHECELDLLDRYALRTATASLQGDLSDPTTWHDEGVLFWERGFARDPHVIWEPEQKQWVMYFNRKIERTRLGGMTGVSYKVSQDLVHWSEETRDVISDIPDTQLLSGAAESPQVVFYRGYWYLFFTHPMFCQDYYATFVFRSTTPYDFGTFEEPITQVYTHAPEVFSVSGQWYITHTGDVTGGQLYGSDPDYQPPGVQIARLRWVPEE